MRGKQNESEDMTNLHRVMLILAVVASLPPHPQAHVRAASTSAWSYPKDKVRAVLRLDAANALDDVRPNALERSPFKTFRTVGRNIFCAALSPSAIGLLGTFGQKPDQISYVRRPSSKSKLTPCAARTSSGSV